MTLLCYYDAYLTNLVLSSVTHKIRCTVNVKSARRFLIKKDQLSAKWQRRLNAQKEKYHDDPENKRQAVKKGYDDKKEYIKQ